MTEAGAAGVERRRMADAGHLEEGLDTASPWYQWGPYVSERAWGSVREDYSADGDAWSSFPHDHARSRAYRWNEDGMAGLSDVFGRLNLGLALWNGEDPILKERMFGLTNGQGNHGEDVKDYWWYLDAVPSSAWLRWRYHYPQAAFPYRAADRRERPAVEAGPGVRAARHRHLRRQPLLDRRGRVREGRSRPTSWRGSPSATRAPRRRRSTCCRRSGSATSGRTTRRATGRPWMPTRGGSRIRASHPELGDYELHVGAGPDGTPPALLFCENETNAPRIFGSPATTPWPKDGINDHVIDGAADRQPRRRPGPRRRRGTAWRSGRASRGRSASGFGPRRRRSRPPRPSTRRSCWVPASRPRWPPASPRPTSSTPTCGGPGRPTTRR